MPRNVVFVWNDDQGKLRVTWPVWKAQKPHESDDQFLERVARKLPQPLAMHPDKLPKSRANRSSWVVRDGKVVEREEPST
jgi:hypothetical protein